VASVDRGEIDACNVSRPETLPEVASKVKFDEVAEGRVGCNWTVAQAWLSTNTKPCVAPLTFINYLIATVAGKPLPRF
jgi:hypothetical protein